MKFEVHMSLGKVLLLVDKGRWEEEEEEEEEEVWRKRKKKNEQI